MEKYKFFVHRAEEVDFNRIARESRPEWNIILVTASSNTVVMARQSFLDRFKSCDGASLAYRLLEPRWGVTHLRLCDGGTPESAITFFPYTGGDQYVSIPGWRFVVLNNEYLPTVFKEIEALKTFRTPKRPVTVRGCAL